METVKKQKFCLGAAFLFLPILFGLFIYFYYLNLFGNIIIPSDFLYFLIYTLIMVLIILLFIKNTGILTSFVSKITNVLLPILGGILGLLTLSASLMQFNPVKIRKYGIGAIDILNFLSMCLFAASWILLSLIALSVNKKIPFLKIKSSILIKIFYFSVIISTALYILSGFQYIPTSIYHHKLIYADHNPATDFIRIKAHWIFYIFTVFELFSYNFARAFADIFFTVISSIGMILICNWIINPYKAESAKTENTKKVANDSSVNSKYYVSLGKHICLTIVTFGIWHLIWVYRTTEYTNNAPNEEYRNPKNKLLLYMFVPFYAIYWTYKTALRIDKIGQNKNIQSELGTVCLILAIFVGIVPPILMQDKINKILTQPDAIKSEPTPDIESLKKYKELLDLGIITQEEFDAKKKQLLNL